MPYDTDGSVAFRDRHGTYTAYGPNSGTIRGLNDELSNRVIAMDIGGPGLPVFCGVIFPQSRDIRGLYCNYEDAPITLQYSLNSTNGIDGNWSNVPGSSYVEAITNQTYRSNIISVNLNGVTSIRIWRSNGYGGSNGPKSLHIYGSYAAGALDDRLRPWHPTLDEPLDDPTSEDGAWLDFGNVPRATTADKTFRIKNNSGTLTANAIDISTTIITDGSPTIPPQFTYSDGGAFATTINIGTLSPGQISPVITIRRTTPSNAALGLWSPRVNSVPASWS